MKPTCFHRRGRNQKKRSKILLPTDSAPLERLKSLTNSWSQKVIMLVSVSVAAGWRDGFELGRSDNLTGRAATGETSRRNPSFSQRSCHRFISALRSGGRRFRCALRATKRGPQNAGGGLQRSCCTWLMHDSCLEKGVEEETVRLRASTDSARLTGGFHTNMKGPDLQRFEVRVSLHVDPHPLLLPLRFQTSTCQPLLLFHLIFVTSFFHTNSERFAAGRVRVNGPEQHLRIKASQTLFTYRCRVYRFIFHE